MIQFSCIDVTPNFMAVWSFNLKLLSYNLKQLNIIIFSNITWASVKIVKIASRKLTAVRHSVWYSITKGQILKGFRSYFKGVVLAPSYVCRRLFECDKRLEWVNHSPVGDKWVMTDPHEPFKFKTNNPLSRIPHRKPTARGAWCSKNSLEIGPESL